MFAAQIDLPLANVERVNEQLHNVFGFTPEEGIQVHVMLCVAALNGISEP